MNVKNSAASVDEKFIWKKKESLPSSGDKTSYDLQGQLARLREKRIEKERLKKDPFDSSAMAMTSPDDAKQKEHIFFLLQSVQKAQMRLSSGKGLPIDPLVLSMHHIYQGFQVQKNSISLSAVPEYPQPFTHISCQPLSEIESLLKDDIPEVMTSVSAIGSAASLSYWKSVVIICQYFKSKKSSSHSSSIHHLVLSDVREVFKGKSVDELSQLSSKITFHIENSKSIDYDYWKSVFDELELFRAKVK